MIDSALIRTIGFRVSEDKGRLLENTVFLQLKMQGHDIYFHKNQKECDFVIRQNNQITQVIQVTQTLSHESVKKREIEGLIEAMSTYDLTEGLIITENEESLLEIEGYKIKVIPLWKWLLMPNVINNLC